MKNIRIPDFNKLTEQITLYAQLKSEYGAAGIHTVLSDAEQKFRSALAQIKKLPIDRTLAKEEPNNLSAIQDLRKSGPRRLWQSFDKKNYPEKMEGALLGRMAACTLGAPVEFWPVDKMKALAKENGDEFPPTDYWNYVPEPETKRYGVSKRKEYTRN